MIQCKQLAHFPT